MTRVLRFAAILIAIAGAIDPAITVSGASRARLAIVAPTPAPPAADDIRARLVRALSPSYEITAAVTSDAAAAIVIGDRYPAEPMPASLMIATVSVPAPAGAGVGIAHVDAPREVPAGSVIHVDLDVERAATTAPATDVTATIAGLEAGRASHRWTAGETRWRAGLDAVPIGEPPYLLRIAAGPASADVVVDARRAPFRVEFYDPRPSWATTFVRRALEADARFQVAGLSFTSRAVSVQSGGAVPLADPRLDAFDVVIVGGLDRLTAADAGALDRYLRERGGAVVVVPDQRVDAGAARDLIAAPASAFASQPRRDGHDQPDPTERLLEQPATLAVTPPAAPIQASELLVFRALPPGAEVIARVPGPSSASGASRASSRDENAAPVIVVAPHGNGRLMVSGAMDAWRYRATDNGAFDRFWQSAIAGLALAAPPPIAIDVEPPIVRPGERGQIRVRVRASAVTAVSASLDGDQPIRLRPDPETGVYRGDFVAKSTTGRSTLDVRVAAVPALSAARTLLVRPDARPAPASSTPSLAMLSASHRGADVDPARLSELERFVRGAVSAPRVPMQRHPMRSAWWMLPFAACLSAEWWLRRRRGLR